MQPPLDFILHSLEDAVLCLDEDGRALWMNHAAMRRFGVDALHAPGRASLSPTALTDVVAQLDLKAMAQAPSVAKPAVRRVNLSRPESNPIPLEAVVSSLDHEGRRVFTVVFREVAYLLQMEKAIYESRKAQALAGLAGGIAHDFNNILTAVISQLDLALDGAGLPASLREHLIYAQTSARRGAELVSRLQTFSHQGKPEFAPLNLIEVIDQAVFVLKRSIDPQITVAWSPPAQTPWLARADAHQVTQALFNLAINARDAMPQGGRLTFELANRSFSAANSRGPQIPGDFVQLTVRDTGRGMTPEVAARVFDPYFSTKDLSRGPGLGLTMSSAVVNEHGGWMEVESQPGKGSSFTMFLPRAAEPAIVPKPVAVADPKATEGKECVMIVDDEELVRLVTKAVLAYRGYEVLEAEDGQDAVDKYAANPNLVDLVLMDMHMPRLSGYEALLQIRAINPRAPVIMLSGGVHDPEAGLVDLEGAAFLHKPFENQELLRLVRRLLDARAQPLGK
jgi:signal transduction histidine kinase/ActR/RegA family two-component response regulator